MPSGIGIGIDAGFLRIDLPGSARNLARQCVQQKKYSTPSCVYSRRRGLRIDRHPAYRIDGGLGVQPLLHHVPGRLQKEKSKGEPRMKHGLRPRNKRRRWESGGISGSSVFRCSTGEIGLNASYQGADAEDRRAYLFGGPVHVQQPRVHSVETFGFRSFAV